MLTAIEILGGVFVLPFLLGAGVARLLRVREMSTRLGLVFFAAIVGLTPFVYQYILGAQEQKAYQEALTRWNAEGKAAGDKEPKRPEPRTWKSAIKLGIDLQGGTNLVFQVRSDEKAVTPQVLAQMVGAVSRRINPTGTSEVVVRSVGKDRIEVIVPGADPEEVKRIKDLIIRLGSLEFAILARHPEDTAHINKAQTLKPKEIDVRGLNNRIVASWRDVAVDKEGKLKESGGTLREVERDGKKITQTLILVLPEEQRVTGKYLTRAFETMSDSGSAAVGFEFNSRGGRLFQNLTSKNLPKADGTKRQLAILLDNQIHSAPTINDTISTSGIITGRFSSAEINELISVLNAGALEVPIDPTPVSEFSVGPLLAHDVQEKGMMAVYVSSILVIVFMLIYYMVAGAVADLCLLVNIVLILGSMAYIDATFTLPGIAGIVLTIGMAVDANVLIYERMREEKQRGASLRMQIQNGFDRALSAIIDSNVTTLITAAILYMIGTDQIRGFAVTLFVGLTASMFTAVFMGRVVFDLIERKRWLRELKMMSVIPVPNVDWLSWRNAAVGLSGVIIAIGMIALAIRGVDNLDIDFTGGTMVTMEFEEPQELNEVKRVLQTSELGSTTSVERLELLGQKEEGDKGTRYRIRTKIQEIDQVRQIVDTSLAAANLKLRRVTVTPGKIVDLSSEGAESEGSAEFPDGRQVKLTFSSGLKASTAEDYFLTSLENLKAADGKPKFPEARSLLNVAGVEKASEADQESFRSVLLTTSRQIAEEDLSAALASMKERMATQPIFDEISTFDSSVADEMKETALIAIVLSLVAIVGYIWFRFERITWGLAAVAALAHDVLVTLGAIPLAAYLSGTALGPILGLEDFKINLGVVASILTIIGYSLNDTIVIFDRIREIRGKNPHLTAEMLNLSVNQTMSRTILTSLTVLIVVVIMYVVGGEGLHSFAFTLIIGVISGTWSTIYMANPVLLWLMNRPGAPVGRSVPATPQSAKTVTAG